MKNKRRYGSEITSRLKKTLKKLFRKDKNRYEAVLGKIDEILNSDNPRHYKNLSYDLKEFKRVHIDSSFVLVFKVDDSEKTIKFEDIRHHDEIYKG